MDQGKLLIPKDQNWQRDSIILTILWLATIGFYYASLLGGDLEFIKANLPSLGRYLVLSCLSFFTFNLLFFRWFASTAYSSSGGWAMKVIQLLVTIGTVIGLYLMDTGENFEHHGAYNITIFLILFFPSTLITLAVMSFVKWLSPRNRQRCKISSFIGLLALLIYTVLALWFYNWKWSKGLNDTQIKYDNGVCEFRGTNIPWIDLFPDGAQNFWTGSQTCPSLPKKYTAKIQDGKVYVTGCSTTPKVTFFPDTKGISYTQKVYQAFQVTVKNNWITKDVSSSTGVKIPSGVESMWVECGEDQERQMLFHTTVPETPSTPTASSTIPANLNATAHGVGKDVVAEAGDADKKPNILIIYVDALARRHFHRKMIKTNQWLEKMHKGDQMDVLQFFRYHGVGFNTDLNSRAMYCGQNEDSSDFFVSGPKSPLCPVWKPLKKNLDYSTVLITDFCEDWPAMFMGVSRSEFADHEMLAPFCHPDYYPYEGNAFGNFKGPYSILRRCLFGEYVHKHSLNYMENILRTYKDSKKPYYMHSIFTEAHEGTGEVISTMDDDLSNFLIKAENEQLLDNTIVVFISDHGLHMGLNFAFSTNGAIEHKLPLLNILIPTNFNKQQRDKLRANEQKLITAYEVHKTLLMLPGFRADGSFKPEESTKLFESSSPLSNVSSHLSLFDEISWTRTCKDARIPDDTCVCDVKGTAQAHEKVPKNGTGAFLPNPSD